MVAPSGSELKQLRDALRNCEEKFEKTFRSIPDSITLTDLETGVFVEVNQSFERLSGFTREEALGRTGSELGLYAGSSRAEMVEQLKARGSLKNLEIRTRTKSGDEGVALLSAEIVNLNGRDCILAVARDITARKRMDDQLRLHAQLLDAVGQAVMATTLDGRITFWNKFAEQMYGWSAEEAVGQNAAIVVPPDHPDAGLQIVERVRQGGRWSGEVMLQRRDGSVFPALVTATPIHGDKGSVTGVVGVSMDISDRKHFEQAMQAQQEAIRELSTPVLQVREGMLIVPIIGAVDAERARQLTEQVLSSIRRNRARVAVMDVTGVATIDTHVANRLLQIAGASRLLGASVIVTGISREIAQTLVSLGVELNALTTLGDLQSGIEEGNRLLQQV